MKILNKIWLLICIMLYRSTAFAYNVRPEDLEPDNVTPPIVYKIIYALIVLWIIFVIGVGIYELILKKFFPKKPLDFTRNIGDYKYHSHIKAFFHYNKEDEPQSKFILVEETSGLYVYSKGGDLYCADYTTVVWTKHPEDSCFKKVELNPFYGNADKGVWGKYKYRCRRDEIIDLYHIGWLYWYFNM